MFRVKAILKHKCWIVYRAMATECTPLNWDSQIPVPTKVCILMVLGIIILSTR